MVRTTNPAGYVKYGSEKELCNELEKYFFPNFFDDNWKPIEEETKEVWLSFKDRIDYFGYIDGRPSYVEVKNWWVTSDDIKQIIRYNEMIEEKHPSWGKFYLICGGIDEERYNLLLFHPKSRLARVILIKDIKEINPEEVSYWM